mmetsp:Transcript_16534/g.30293  ORF Transcript_16534/g.30293 Transcript_16534/m.30293 type:complete len:102 (+) Transcript_16534:625-930(+)
MTSKRGTKAGTAWNSEELFAGDEVPSRNHTKTVDYLGGVTRKRNGRVLPLHPTFAHPSLQGTDVVDLSSLLHLEHKSVSKLESHQSKYSTALLKPKRLCDV